MLRWSRLLRGVCSGRRGLKTQGQLRLRTSYKTKAGVILELPYYEQNIHAEILAIGTATGKFDVCLGFQRFLIIPSSRPARADYIPTLTRQGRQPGAPHSVPSRSYRVSDSETRS